MKAYTVLQIPQVEFKSNSYYGAWNCVILFSFAIGYRKLIKEEILINLTIISSWRKYSNREDWRTHFVSIEELKHL